MRGTTISPLLRVHSIEHFFGLLGHQVPALAQVCAEVKIPCIFWVWQLIGSERRQLEDPCVVSVTRHSLSALKQSSSEIFYMCSNIHFAAPHVSECPHRALLSPERQGASRPHTPHLCVMGTALPSMRSASFLVVAPTWAQIFRSELPAFTISANSPVQALAQRSCRAPLTSTTLLGSPLPRPPPPFNDTPHCSTSKASIKQISVSPGGPIAAYGLLPTHTSPGALCSHTDLQPALPVHVSVMLPPTHALNLRALGLREAASLAGLGEGEDLCAKKRKVNVHTWSEEASKHGCVSSGGAPKGHLRRFQSTLGVAGEEGFGWIAHMAARHSQRAMNKYA